MTPQPAGRERGILFQGWGVRAILDGRKSQTRRVIRPQPVMLPIWELGKGNHCPYGLPGDLLWVRETWSPWADEATRLLILHNGEKCLYRADYMDGASSLEVGGDYHWHPAIHMPRWASRLTLRLIDVRVQRVQEISEEDARAEGVEPDGGPAVHSWIRPFVRAWDAINAKRPGCNWEANPWVWALSYVASPQGR